MLLDTGKPIRGIGAGLFVFPHGLHVDHDGTLLGAVNAAPRGITRYRKK